MPNESPGRKSKRQSSEEDSPKDKKRRKKDSDSEDEKDVNKNNAKGQDNKSSEKTVEREIEDLCRERGRIQDALRRMEDNHKKFLLTLEANEMRKIKQEEDKKKAAGKKARESGDESSGDDKEKKKDEKGPKDKDKKRSGPVRERALFGFLQNHLKKAKKEIDEEGSGSKRSKVDLDKPLGEVKLSAQSKAQQEAKDRQFNERKSKEENRLYEIDKMIQQKETLLLQGRLEKHYSLMMNFIRTKAEPTIFYLPAKHNSTTEKFLEETRQAIKNKIASLEVQLQPLDPPEELANGVAKDGEGDDEKDDEKKDSDSDGDEDSIPEGAPRNAKEAGDDDKSDKSDKSDGQPP